MEYCGEPDYNYCGELDFYGMNNIQNAYNVFIRSISVCSDNERARAKNLHIKPRFDTKEELDNLSNELEGLKYYTYKPLSKELKGKCITRIYLCEEIMYVMYIETDEKQAKKYYVKVGEVSQIQVWSTKKGVGIKC